MTNSTNHQPDKSHNKGPLEGLKVLEISSVIMVPFAGSILAKLGADVLRIEPPNGDSLRQTGAQRDYRVSGSVVSFWDQKRSLTLDLKSDNGRKLLFALFENADIIVTNLLASKREKLGITWAIIRELNPRAIFCTAQGFKTGSEWEDRPAYDDTIQAASGICDIYRLSSGTPRLAPYVVADKVCGITIVYSCLAALHHRSSTGRGQHVEVPMMDTMVHFNLAEQLNDYAFDPPLGSAGWHRTLAPQRRPHECRDGWVCVLPYTDKNWSAFMEHIGAPSDEYKHLQTRKGRIQHADEVHALIESYTRVRKAETVQDELASLGIPYSEVNSLESLMEHDYLRSMNTISRVSNPQIGNYWRTTPNISFSESPCLSAEIEDFFKLNQSKAIEEWTR